MSDNNRLIQKQCLHCPSLHFFVTEGYTMRGRIEPEHPRIMECDYAQGSADGVLYFECANCHVRYSSDAVEGFDIR